MTKPVSYWIDSTPPSDYPALREDTTVDVAVIGGGIVGLTAAALLQRAGRSVAVLESRRIAAQVTGHTSAKLTSLHGLIYARLIRQHGEGRARLYAESNEAAIAQIDGLIRERRIDCDFERKSAYTYSEPRRGLADIEAEVDAANRIGLTAAFVEESSLPFPIAGAVRLDHQAQFHPRKYLLALTAALAGEGVAVYEGTRVLGVEEGSPCSVITAQGRVTARDVIVATHLPILDRGGFFSRVYPRRHLILAASIDKSQAPDGMFISTGTPSHSIRVQRKEDGSLLLIVVGGKFKTGEGDSRAQLRELEDFVEARFGHPKIEYRWGNQDYDSADHLPYIGPLTPFSTHLYTATGFGGWGLTLGTVAAMMLSDRIRGRKNPWTELYNSNRIHPLRSGKRFVRENLQVGKTFIKGRMPGPRTLPLTELGPGEGGLVRIHDQTAAVYKDEQGVMHAVSPVCTHMGCALAWNAVERSWDCPCHGSRFDHDGIVLNGPAVKDLKPVALD